jgi:hypothetical protein
MKEMGLTHTLWALGVMDNERLVIPLGRKKEPKPPHHQQELKKMQE